MTQTKNGRTYEGHTSHITDSLGRKVSVSPVWCVWGWVVIKCQGFGRGIGVCLCLPGCCFGGVWFSFGLLIYFWSGLKRRFWVNNHRCFWLGFGWEGFGKACFLAFGEWRVLIVILGLWGKVGTVSYRLLRVHETVPELVSRSSAWKKKQIEHINYYLTQRHI